MGALFVWYGIPGEEETQNSVVPRSSNLIKKIQPKQRPPTSLRVAGAEHFALPREKMSRIELRKGIERTKTVFGWRSFNKADGDDVWRWLGKNERSNERPTTMWIRLGGVSPEKSHRETDETNGC